MDLNFDKMNGLVPAIIQDNYTQKVLMLGFMNEEAYQKTVETGKVTFFSRTKNRLPCRTCLPPWHRYLLGRQKRAGHNVP